MLEIFKTLARAAMSEAAVLVLGESGTGKELIARAIHQNSSRRQKKFIAVNCGALTDTLLESELFGHVKGSFTGASETRKGLFEEANGGTLFLDEIGDVSPQMQVKLLRILQDGEYRPVGGNDTRTADVRIIAATHRNLSQLVADGKFREDLYYRLKVVSLEIPSLRSRKEDIAELVGYFLGQVHEEYTTSRCRTCRLRRCSPLENYAFSAPATSAASLENAIERAVALANTAQIDVDDLPVEILRRGAEKAEAPDGNRRRRSAGGARLSEEPREAAYYQGAHSGKLQQEPRRRDSRNRPGDALQKSPEVRYRSSRKMTDQTRS